MDCGGELQLAASGLPPSETGVRNGFHGGTLFLKETTTEII